MDKESDALDYRRRYRGLIGVRSKMPIRDVSVLSRIYTPGVGAVCKEIAQESRLVLPLYLPGQFHRPDLGRQPGL